MKKNWNKLLLWTIASIILIATVSLTLTFQRVNTYATESVSIEETLESGEDSVPMVGAGAIPSGESSKKPEVEADVERLDSNHMYLYLLGTLITAAAGITIVMRLRNKRFSGNDQ